MWVGRCMYTYSYVHIKVHRCIYTCVYTSLYRTFLVLHVFQYICFIERVGKDPTGPYLRVMGSS